MPLLHHDEPSPVTIVNPDGRSPVVLVCEHASNRLPAALGDMGLQPHHRQSHIAWDIGAEAVARAMAARLGAPLFVQNYSRLVCDCNRRTTAADFIPLLSESIAIPGNAGLTEAEREDRIREVFTPFHTAVAAEVDRRITRRNPVILVTIHSFTPRFNGLDRPWHIGVLFNRSRELPGRIIRLLRRDTSYLIGENRPYSMSDETDYTIPVHGEAHGLPSAEIEIRNDLVQTAAQQEKMARLLGRIITGAGREAPA